MPSTSDDNVDVRLVLRDYERQRLELERLKSGDGGGTSGDVTDDWKSSVDRQLTQLHSDVRNLLLGGLAAIVLILGALTTGYLSLDNRLDGLTVTVAKMDAKLDLLVDRSAPKR